MTADDAIRAAARGPFPLALVSVVEASGSTPRSSGARMAVFPDGKTVGTVGGGKPEALAIAEARECLAEGRPGSLRVEMTGASAAGVDLICGGEATMWVEIVRDGSPYSAAAAALAAGEAVEIAADPAIGRAGALLEPGDRLLILGGGHVGLALARAAVALSFEVTVADPRPEYSDPARFPPGVACRTGPFAEAIEAFRWGPSAYAVIVSPGHLGDLECARALMAKDCRYAGMIGSRRKSRMILDQLLSEGYAKQKVEGLRSPIGLDIGAETPEEIAVSITAQMIACRRGAADSR